MTFKQALKKAHHVRARVTWGSDTDLHEFLAVTKAAVREQTKRSGEPTQWCYDEEYGMGGWLWLGLSPNAMDKPVQSDT